ncbi:MAG: bifunctional [glutamate--ammonia ligase]-adenylyl-L-tyrosine phosphorylase/[glutamate--ammonia-ligase] adenylyltransferase [Thiothrix sp.]|nr:bifunctional [glutamate--ammonia ligase]-adenylyl-L-tyrosine phosphorylase/[glutamate--ammonia-ligase] adenylyltransferase [Thiothrix sp.]HPQ94153.1 bifunctional [glutamate--ammonia ligase]-adenylyl-L-tyrosine phosphorylase/[glutamate--ammonia-ligase] adenylyltransferase [Thiolinea sp.]
MGTLSDLIKTLTSEQQALVATVLSFSPYLERQLEKHPEQLPTLLVSATRRTEALLSNIGDEITTVADENTLMRTVRLIRHRETVRIAWRDLAGMAALEETMLEVSTLADALTGAVLDWWYRDLCTRHGTPRNPNGAAQHLLVLGMGKLGGRELNFSSDIDLIFAYPENGETDGRRALDNQTFFTRLGQKLINTLGKITADGFAYRVDMRLRPFGDVGALALSFDAMEHYYQTHGREWERYAMIKARVMTGPAAEAAELMQRLRPFIYRRYLDFGAVEQLRDMKLMIDREASRKGKAQDVKLGAGGIREVEFSAQVFQLIRGGRLPDLRQTSLLTTLQALVKHELLTARDAEQLRDGYFFLRQCENRLQMWNDEQTHSLPADTIQQSALARAMGFADWEAFLKVLDQKRQAVNTVFRRVFVVENGEEPAKTPERQLWEQLLDEQQGLTLLEKSGFSPPEDSLSVLNKLRTGRLYQSLTELARERLNRLMPRLIRACAKQESPGLALARSLQVLQSIARRSGYIAMLADNEAALLQFVKLVHASTWITAQLTQYPILLDNLLDIRHLYQPLNRQELDTALKQEMINIDPLDTGQVMERLRQFKLTQVLRVAAADITGMLPLMVVSDQLTWIAEVILEQAVAHAWSLLTAKHGQPRYEKDGQPCVAGLAVVGYGKLGGIELGYSSDLDIVFLHDSEGSQQMTDGPRVLENPVFFARLAQKIIHILTTFTHDGRLYETDTRLRPSGSSGLMVSSLEAFAHYQHENAWVWEHQALLRARAITGNPTLKQRFETVRHEILCLPRKLVDLAAEVSNMRKKMWEALGSKEDAIFIIKKDPGGITDIEFMVQYLILAHAHDHPDLVRWSDNIRQLESLKQNGILSTDKADHLAHIYRLMRNQVHALALQEQKSVVENEALDSERAFVRSCWEAVFPDK